MKSNQIEKLKLAMCLMLAIASGNALAGHGAGNSAQIGLCYKRDMIERDRQGRPILDRNGNEVFNLHLKDEPITVLGLRDLWEGSTEGLYEIAPDLIAVENREEGEIQKLYLERLERREPTRAKLLRQTLAIIAKNSKTIKNAGLEQLNDANTYGITPPTRIGNQEQYCYWLQLVYQKRDDVLSITAAKFQFHELRMAKLKTNLQKFLTKVHEAYYLKDIQEAEAKANDLTRDMKDYLLESPERKAMIAEIAQLRDINSDRARQYNYTVASTYLDRASPEEYFMHLVKKGLLIHDMEYKFSNLHFRTVRYDRGSVAGVLDEETELELLGTPIKFAAGTTVTLAIDENGNVSRAVKAVDGKPVGAVQVKWGAFHARVDSVERIVTKSVESFGIVEFFGLGKTVYDYPETKTEFGKATRMRIQLTPDAPMVHSVNVWGADGGTMTRGTEETGVSLSQFSFLSNDWLGERNIRCLECSGTLRGLPFKSEDPKESAVISFGLGKAFKFFKILLNGYLGSKKGEFIGDQWTLESPFRADTQKRPTIQYSALYPNFTLLPDFGVKSTFRSFVHLHPDLEVKLRNLGDDSAFLTFDAEMKLVKAESFAPLKVDTKVIAKIDGEKIRRDYQVGEKITVRFRSNGTISALE